MMSYNKKVVFVTGCMLCPYFQVVCDIKNISWQRKILNMLLDQNIGIVQMPCPEVTFGGYQEGSQRSSHGIDYYENNVDFMDHCNNLGEKTVNSIQELIVARYEIIGILGVEHSPTCAVNYMYTHKGMCKRKGIFMKTINDKLMEKDINIPFLGVNRSFPNKFIRDFLNSLQK